MQRTFDWKPNHDERSLQFRFANTKTGCTNLTTRASINRRKAVCLDQGKEGACTGFGEEHVRALTPYGQVTDNAKARAVYLEAQKQDEWPGEGYTGSSVNGAMKAARLMGLITAWNWCYNVAELRHALSYHGGVEAGTWWFSGMSQPTAAGYLHVTGRRVGGHAYALSGFRTDPTGAVSYRMENSWGPTWGDRGGAWITEPDVITLMGNDGEFACPVKVRQPSS